MTIQTSCEKEPIENPNANIFYLGINKDTGQLVDVVAPRKGEVRFGPDDFCKLYDKDLDPEVKNDIKKRLSALWIEIREFSIPEIKLTLADKSGHTICGGSCGGIPFWMCG